MASNSARKPARQHPNDPIPEQLRSASRRRSGKSSAHHPTAAPFDTDDEAAGRPAYLLAVEQELTRHAELLEDVQERRAPDSGGVAILVIALMAIATLLATWFVIVS